jgi:sulfate adenylyltransferase
MVERTGGFVLVHVATPVEVCEERDRKGLYARARAGDLPGFTGVSDPYEAPTDAEVVIDTTTGTVDDAADTVLRYLYSAGYLTTH